MALSAEREKSEPEKENTYNIEGSPSRATFLHVNSCEIMLKYAKVQTKDYRKDWNHCKPEIRV